VILFLRTPLKAIIHTEWAHTMAIVSRRRSTQYRQLLLLNVYIFHIRTIRFKLLQPSNITSMKFS